MGGGGRSDSSSSGEEDGDANWRAAINSIVATTSYSGHTSNGHVSASNGNGSIKNSVGTKESREDDDDVRPQNLKHYQIKAQKLLDELLEKSMEIVQNPIDVPLQDNDSMYNEGGVKLFRDSVPGIVFDHVDELQRPTKRPRILPRKEIDEKSKKAQKLLDELLEKSMEIVQNPIDVPLQDNDSMYNEGGVKLFRDSVPGIVFDHVDELQRPTKRPRILPRKEIDEKSKKAQKLLDELLEKSMEIVQNPIDVPLQDNDSMYNEGGVKLFRDSVPGIVFDHVDELQRPTKRPRILPRKEIDEKSKKAQKLLDELLEKSMEIVQNPIDVPLQDNDSMYNEGGVKLFRDSVPGIVFDHVDELQRPTKRPRILPRKEIDEKSKKFKRQLRSVAVDGKDIIASAQQSNQKSLAKLQAREAAKAAAVKREEERVAELKRIRGERWLPSMARHRQVK